MEALEIEVEESGAIKALAALAQVQRLRAISARLIADESSRLYEAMHGLIPRLAAQGFKGAVYATQATCDLLGVMLPDSGRFAAVEVEDELGDRRIDDLLHPLGEEAHRLDQFIIAGGHDIAHVLADDRECVVPEPQRLRAVRDRLRRLDRHQLARAEAALAVVARLRLYADHNAVRIQRFRRKSAPGEQSTSTATPSCGRRSDAARSRSGRSSTGSTNSVRRMPCAATK